MPTVLWSNKLIEGKVQSDQRDKFALYNHIEKLDRICIGLGEPIFSSIVDNTDLLCNIDQISLPEGMSTTDQLMAEKGVWLETEKASKLISSLIHKINADEIRFGILKNDRDILVDELRESLEFCNSEPVGKFNFCIVM